MEIDYTALGRRIREKRESKKWTQAKLAEMSAVEPSNISHIERAATKVSLPTLVMIANALETSLDELTFDSMVKSSHITTKYIGEMLSDCTDDELKALSEVILTTKTVLRSKK